MTSYKIWQYSLPVILANISNLLNMEEIEIVKGEIHKINPFYNWATTVKKTTSTLLILHYLQRIDESLDT
jgi:hypothetical protein